MCSMANMASKRIAISDAWEELGVVPKTRARYRHFLLAHTPSDGLIWRIWQALCAQGWQGVPQNEAGTERMWARILEAQWVSARLVPEILFSMCEKCLPFTGSEAGIKDHPAYAFATGRAYSYAGRDFDKLAAETCREVVRTMTARLFAAALKAERARLEKDAAGNAAGSVAGSAAGEIPPDPREAPEA